jgi:hypothetical protein
MKFCSKVAQRRINRMLQHTVNKVSSLREYCTVILYLFRIPQEDSFKLSGAFFKLVRDFFYLVHVFPAFSGSFAGEWRRPGEKDRRRLSPGRALLAVVNLQFICKSIFARACFDSAFCR